MKQYYNVVPVVVLFSVLACARGTHYGLWSVGIEDEDSDSIVIRDTTSFFTF